MHPSYTAVYVKSLQSGADSLDSLTQLVYEHEDTTLHLTPPAVPSPPPVTKRPTSPPAQPRGKSAFLRCPTTCVSPPCSKAAHSTRLCDQQCELPGCPSPGFAHKARTCALLHDRGAPQALCAQHQPVSLPSMPTCLPPPSQPLSPARLRKRTFWALSHRSLASQSTVSTLPPLKLDTGASVLVSPTPLICCRWLYCCYYWLVFCRIALSAYYSSAQ